VMVPNVVQRWSRSSRGVQQRNFVMGSLRSERYFSGQFVVIIEIRMILN
jgi:hypothetical protein